MYKLINTCSQQHNPHKSEYSPHAFAMSLMEMKVNVPNITNNDIH